MKSVNDNCLQLPWFLVKNLSILAANHVKLLKVYVNWAWTEIFEIGLKWNMSLWNAENCSWVYISMNVNSLIHHHYFQILNQLTWKKASKRYLIEIVKAEVKTSKIRPLWKLPSFLFSTVFLGKFGWEIMMQVTICYIFQEGERIISLWEQKCLVNYLSSLSGDKHTPLKLESDVVDIQCSWFSRSLNRIFAIQIQSGKIDEHNSNNLRQNNFVELKKYLL